MSRSCARRTRNELARPLPMENKPPIKERGRSGKEIISDRCREEKENFGCGRAGELCMKLMPIVAAISSSAASKNVLSIPIRSEISMPAVGAAAMAMTWPML